MALFVYGLAADELSRNEDRRAPVAAAVLCGGGWLVLTLSGEPLLTKPPGMSIAFTLASLPEGRGTAVTALAVGWVALAETVRREALLRLSPGQHPRPYPWGELVTFSAHVPAGLPAVVGARATHPAPRARRPVGRLRRQAALAIALLSQPAILLHKGVKMSFSDLFGWSRSRRAPTSFRKRVPFTVELLESRLAPSASSWPCPSITGAPPSEASLCNMHTPAATVQAPVSGARLAGVNANGAYTVTLSSDAQHGTGWNGYAPSSGAPTGPQGGAPAVNAVPPGGPAYAAYVPGPGDYFNLTLSGDHQAGQGWAVSALQLTPPG